MLAHPKAVGECWFEQGCMWRAYSTGRRDRGAKNYKNKTAAYIAIGINKENNCIRYDA